MNTLGFLERKNKNAPDSERQVQYLALGSEPAERPMSARPTFSYRNRYLAKRRVMRTLRRLRRDQLS